MHLFISHIILQDLSIFLITKQNYEAHFNSYFSVYHQF